MVQLNGFIYGILSRKAEARRRKKKTTTTLIHNKADVAHSVESQRAHSAVIYCSTWPMYTQIVITSMSFFFLSTSFCWFVFRLVWNFLIETLIAIWWRMEKKAAAHTTTRLKRIITTELKWETGLLMKDEYNKKKKQNKTEHNDFRSIFQSNWIRVVFINSRQPVCRKHTHHFS